ncbi:MAG: hypothetical protein M5R36_16100 [Deltaproteobacteria bacterium]|nr:hypothetical protein [Deltaproteobacteria bacterium]
MNFRKLTFCMILLLLGAGMVFWACAKDDGGDGDPAHKTGDDDDGLPAPDDDDDSGDTGDDDDDDDVTDDDDTGWHPPDDDDSWHPPDDDDSWHPPDDDTDDDADDDDDDLSYPNDPMDEGPYVAGQKNLTYPDAGTGLNKTLMAYYPSQDNGTSVDVQEGRRPIVLIHAGEGIKKEVYASYARHLATWGYAALIFENHVRSEVKLSDAVTGIIDWLATLVGGDTAPLGPGIDLGKLGAVGHGLGGKIIYHASLDEPRLRVACALDPDDAKPDVPIPPGDYFSMLDGPMALVDIATMHVGSGQGGDCVDEDENFEQFYLLSPKPSIEINILGAGYTAFLDNPNCGTACADCTAGTANHLHVKDLARRYVTAFFNVHLRGLSAYSQWITGTGIQEDEVNGDVTSQHKE